MSTVALGAGPGAGGGQDGWGDGHREALRWGISLATIVALHLALASYLLTRSPPAEPAGETLPAVLISLPPPGSTPRDAGPTAMPSELVPPSAAPDPVLEEVPDVPDAEVPPPPDAAPREIVLDPPPETPPALVPPPPRAEPAAPPSPAAALPPPAKPVTPPPPKPAVRKPPLESKPAERKPLRPAKAEQPGERRIERRPAAEAAGTRRDLARPGMGGAATAASSAAWRSQLVAYLQRSLRYPPGATSGGAAYVSFSVGRGGQVLSASLSRSSGNPALDAAALAVFRGSVPPPPRDYAGSLSFNIPIRFNQR